MKMLKTLLTVTAICNITLLQSYASQQDNNMVFIYGLTRTPFADLVGEYDPSNKSASLYNKEIEPGYKQSSSSFSPERKADSRKHTIVPYDDKRLFTKYTIRETVVPAVATFENVQKSPGKGLIAFAEYHPIGIYTPNTVTLYGKQVNSK